MSLRNLQTMKRKSISSIPPSTPPTPQHLTHFRPIIASSKTSLKTLSLNPNWTPLNLTNSDLNLSLTFPTGQTFRWKQTAPLQFTGVIAETHVVSLKELQDGNIGYYVHDFDDGGVELLEKSLLDMDYDDGGVELLEKSLLDRDDDVGGVELLEKSLLDKVDDDGGVELLEKSLLDKVDDGGVELLEKSLRDKHNDVGGVELLNKSLLDKDDENGGVEFLEKSLLDFLNMGISLYDLWEEFKVKDERFSELAERFPGVRVLRQEPLECLIQFICSSNNNISRITKMVDYVSSLGRKLGSVGGFDFYGFPSLDRLSMVSEAELRDSGFGYR